MKEENHSCINSNQTKEHIERYGLSVVKIEATNYLPSFVYSVGLMETLNHPEIICFGLSTQLMHQIVNDVAELIKVEGTLSLDKEYGNIFSDSRAKFLEVDKRNIEDYFGAAIKYYNTTEINGFQLVWTDRNNKFPWEDGFEDEFKFRQPLLDRNSGFKFKEETNLGIFTTRQWLEDNEPILRVIHEEDGDWQFLTKEIDSEDGRLVALGQMILRDRTLNELFDLEYGEEAERNFIGDRWRRSKFKASNEKS